MGHIILVVATSGSPTVGDLVIQGRLEAAGHTVTRTSDEDAEYSGSYDGVVVSDSCSGGTFGAKYDTVTKPGLTFEAASWRLGTYSGAADATQWSVNAVPAANGGLTGTQTVYDATQPQQGISVSSLPAAATVVATQQGDSNKGVYVVYEAGGALTSGTATARRAFLRIGDGAMDNLTSAGTTLLDAAIGWTFDSGSGGGGQVTLRASSEDARGNATTAVASLPAGTQAGDLLLAIQATDEDGSLSAMTAPAGWSEIANFSRFGDVGGVKVWRKTATASEPSTYEFPDSTSAHCSVVVMALTGHDPTQPIAVSPTFAEGGAATTHTAPSVTGEADGLLLTAHIAGTDGTTRSYTTPSGMTLVRQSTLSSGAWLLLGVYSQGLASSGATGSRTTVCSGSAPFIALSMVVRAPSSLTVSPPGINSAEAFGSPSVSVADEGQTVSAIGIGTAEAVGAPTVTQPAGVGPFPGLTLFPGSNVFPNEPAPEHQHQTLLPATINSGEAFGSPIVANSDGVQTVIVTGIDPGETFPVPNVTVDPIPPLDVETVGIFTAEAFGRPVLVLEIPTPTPTGLDTYFIDGFDLRSLASRIETAEGLLDTPGVVGDDVALPGRDGELQVFGGLGQPRRADAAGRITFNLWLKGVDPDTGEVTDGSTTQEEWFDRWDDLIRRMHRRIVVIDHARPDGGIRRAFAHLLPGESITPSRFPGSVWFARFRAVFAIPAGHWTDLTPVTTGVLSLPTNGHIDLSIFGRATAPCTELQVVFHAANNPRVSTSVGHLGWNGVITPGRQLGIDTVTGLTHQASGAAWVPGFDGLTYSPGPRLFEIDPSEPLQAIFTHTTGGFVDIEISGKRRYRTS